MPDHLKDYSARIEVLQSYAVELGGVLLSCCTSASYVEDLKARTGSDARLILAIWAQEREQSDLCTDYDEIIGIIMEMWLRAGLPGRDIGAFNTFTNVYACMNRGQSRSAILPAAAHSGFALPRRC